MTETAVPPAPGLLARMRPLILVGLAVAAIRLMLDTQESAAAMWLGVYYALPVALIVAGVRGTYDDVRWPRLALGMVLVALACWWLPNTVAYTAAQFAGWTHGRFASPERGPPIGDTTFAKVITGLSVGALTTVAGTVWLIVWATVVVWIPARVRARRSAQASRA